MSAVENGICWGKQYTDECPVSPREVIAFRDDRMREPDGTFESTSTLKGLLDHVKEKFKRCVKRTLVVVKETILLEHQNILNIQIEMFLTIEEKIRDRNEQYLDAQGDLNRVMDVQEDFEAWEKQFRKTQAEKTLLVREWGHVRRLAAKRETFKNLKLLDLCWHAIYDKEEDEVSGNVWGEKQVEGQV